MIQIDKGKTKVILLDTILLRRDIMPRKYLSQEKKNLRYWKYQEQFLAENGKLP